MSAFTTPLNFDIPAFTVSMAAEISAVAALTVTFRGRVQEAPAATDFGGYANEPEVVPNPDSDWRWGLVARGADGARRYSPLQRGALATLSFAVEPDDEEL